MAATVLAWVFNTSGFAMVDELDGGTVERAETLHIVAATLLLVAPYRWGWRSGSDTDWCTRFGRSFGGVVERQYGSIRPNQLSPTVDPGRYCRLMAFHFPVENR